MVRDPPGGPNVVGGPIRRSGSGRETLPEVRKWSGDPLLSPEVVGELIRRSANGRRTLPEVQKWSGDVPGDPEVDGGPSRWFGSSLSTLLRFGNGRGTLP